MVSAMAAERLAGLDHRYGLHLLVAHRAHIVVQRFEVGEQFVDLSALVTFLERDVRRLEQVAFLDIVPGSLQADVGHAIVTKVAPADVDPHMLTYLNSCHVVIPALWRYF